mgnify:FL=1
MEKYKFTEEKMFHNGRVLKRIIRIEDNLVGGWIESEKNLSQSGKCFVYGDAKVYDNAEVYGDVIVCDSAIIYDNAEVCGNAEICGDVIVCGSATIYDNATIYGNATIYCNATIYGNAEVYDNAEVCGNAEVYDNAKVYGNAKVLGDVMVCGEDEIENGYIQVSYKDVQIYKNKSSRTVTALLTNDGWRFNVGCQKLITKEFFLYRIHNNDGGLYKNPHREFYLKILSLF